MNINKLLNSILHYEIKFAVWSCILITNSKAASVSYLQVHPYFCGCPAGHGIWEAWLLGITDRGFDTVCAVSSEESTACCSRSHRTFPTL